ncbi:MAG: serine/threonine protein kinase [Deltaproteobacteria bacterium]|nr:serine/threonine protein kinase [Deltaproteobacteria bacterium]
MSFQNLLPDLIYQVVSQEGYLPTGTLFPLNSYENRVYEIHLEDHEPLIAKFYRPDRWTLDAIDEEHRFLEKLEEMEVPVVSPLLLKKPLVPFRFLGKIQEYPYALFPKFRGREHADFSSEDRQWLGRTLARLHNIGEHFDCRHRMLLSPETYGDASLEFILNRPFIPSDLKQNIETILKEALDQIDPFFNESLQPILLHGDCHPGNILWNHQGPTLVDFDDMVLAPVVQDLWMLFHGSESEKREQKEAFFKGYSLFRNFNENDFILSEPLRTLRMIRHVAWIGQRYDEPLFRKAFPYYEEHRFWEEFLLSMKEQLSLLYER